jgi:predicted NBD/HSP70 family sugar kinase
MSTPGTPSTGRGNSNDVVRRHNLSALLGLVHHEHSISRSRLTAAMGLNRSTIAALVGELVELGLVVETEPEASNTVGRPSPLVQPDARNVAIAVNPEIDAITVGVVGFAGQVVQRVRRIMPRPPTVAETVAVVAETIDSLGAELPDGYRIVGVGVAVPGLVRASDGLVRLAPHLGWSDEPLADLLAQRTGLPAVASNDASLGANAEHLFGAGRGFSDLVYLNGGASGIGGGIISGGTLLGGASGYAGEFGHTMATASDERDRSGARGSLELEVRRSLLLEVLGLESADADELEAALVASQDPAVLAEVRRQLAFVGVALRNVTNILNPRLIVLGGFLGALHAVDPGVLERAVGDHALRAAAEDVRIARAQLGSDLLLIGAAEIAFAGLLRDPAGQGRESAGQGRESAGLGIGATSRR